VSSRIIVGSHSELPAAHIDGEPGQFICLNWSAVMAMGGYGYGGISLSEQFHVLIDPAQVFNCTDRIFADGLQ
jgi:hypothetical protein